MKSQKEFFNSVAKSWDEICKHDMNKVEYILDLVEIQEGHRILDVGTGTGILIPSLVQRVNQLGEVVAVDVAEKMIEIAREKNHFSNVIFECRDALEYKPDESSYDHIICYSMFPHFKNQEQAIVKLSKKLKTNGKLIICHSESREAINDLHKNVNELVKQDHLPTPEVIKKYFLKAELNVIKIIDNQDMYVIIGCKNDTF